MCYISFVFYNALLVYSSLKRLDTRRTPPGVIDEADMYTYVLSIFESSSVKVCRCITVLT